MTITQSVPQQIAGEAPGCAQLLWQRLLAHHIGPRGAALSFAARLARDNGWSREFAERAILEYRKFCYLAVTGDTPVTPSHAVDQVWHLHLSYTRDYWNEFCPQVLGTNLHHGPTAGGEVEGARYRAQYAQTLQRLEAHFGGIDCEIWPGVKARFEQAAQMHMVDRRTVWLLRKPSVRAALRCWPGLLGAACVLLPMLLIADGRPIYDPSGPDFLKLILVLMLLAALWSWLAARMANQSSAMSRVMTPVELGMSAMDFQRAESVAEVELLQAGVLQLSAGAAAQRGCCGSAQPIARHQAGITAAHRISCAYRGAAPCAGEYAVHEKHPGGAALAH